MPDVHTAHCCLRHHCKYGEDDTCTVVQGIEKQEYLCELCKDEGLTEIPDSDDTNYDLLEKSEFELRNEVKDLREIMKKDDFDQAEELLDRAYDEVRKLHLYGPVKDDEYHLLTSEIHQLADALGTARMKGGPAARKRRVASLVEEMRKMTTKLKEG